MQKHYYVGCSYMGLDYTYDSPCWKACKFDTKKERDEWLRKNEYNAESSKYVAEKITFADALTIAHNVIEDIEYPEQ